MTYDYYPGCTLKNKASELDISSRTAAKYFGIEMCELSEWQCCGGVYPISSNETAKKLPCVRALNDAKENGKNLLCVCSACYHVMKSVNYDMKNSENIRNKANSYLELEPSYNGETRVVHYLEMLRDDIGFNKIKASVKKPINMKIAAYYGCLLLRPSKIMMFDDPENPVIMENFIESVGGNAVIYPFRNECCGGYMAAEDKSLTEKKCHDIIVSAVSHGAEMIITACPLCMYNLKKYSSIPVKYFTEILCDALSIGGDNV